MSATRRRLLTAAVVLAVAALVPKAMAWTRSVTVDAPAEAVWPWLVQMGFDKGGFYNYDWGEQLAGDPVQTPPASTRSGSGSSPATRCTRPRSARPGP